MHEIGESYLCLSFFSRQEREGKLIPDWGQLIAREGREEIRDV